MTAEATEYSTTSTSRYESARVTILRRFGDVPNWLVDRIDHMDGEQWRLFMAWQEREGFLPRDLHDTMPKSSDGMIRCPLYEPEVQKKTMTAKWEEWSRIWGKAPWEQIKPLKLYRRKWGD